LLLIAPLAAPAPAHGAVRYRADGAVRLYRTGGSTQNPAFSPDGQSILFTRFHSGYNRGRAGLYVLSPGSGTAVVLLDESGQQSVNLPGASWNGATGRIVFASDRVDTDEIWTVSSDGSDLFRVTNHATPLHFQEPSLSPDGLWIVFEAVTEAPEDQQQGSIWKVRADGTQLTQLTDGPGGGTDDRQPNWSPAGDRIVFQRRPAGTDLWNLYTMASDGSGIQQVTFDGQDTDASWSPDGQSIVYSSDRTDLSKPAISIVPASGGTLTRVTRDAKYADGAPSWSPDGKLIVFESHRSDRSRAWLWQITAPVPPPPPVACPQCWVPPVQTSWQIQFTGTLDQSVDAQLYDIDLFDNDASTVGTLHAQGRKVICYISAGTWEEWRPDAGQFPSSVLGRSVGSWTGERWLDVRQIAVLGPLMEARLDLCKARGFDGVDFDNVDAYANRSGFPLTYNEQLNYNVWLADAAHARGLSVGLKNDLEQVTELLLYFDWALNEQCFQYDECDLLLPFIAAGKAVMQIEYSLDTSAFCPQANALNFNAMKKHRSLDAYRVPCR
jgi:Tol biopolymer transport system component